MAAKWPNAATEQHVKAFLSKFTDTAGKSIQQPTLIVRASTDLPLSNRPTNSETHGLELAIGFASIDGNPRYRRGQQGWGTQTADNGEVFVWPTDVGRPYVTLRTGSMMLSVVGSGWKISDAAFSIRPPLEVHTGESARLRADVATAVYRLGRGDFDHIDGPLCGRLRAAINWLLKAWKNTASIRPEDRVVFLKTGFEALTDTSKSRQSATKLREIFESLKPIGPIAAKNNELAWSPRERPVHKWTWKSGKTEFMTRLEHWFVAFAEARNTIVHEGHVPRLVYRHRRSPFDGHFVFTAEWILRKAIKIQFERLGARGLWQSDTGRLASRLWRAYAARHK